MPLSFFLPIQSYSKKCKKQKEEKRKRILNRNNTKYLKLDSHFFVYADFQQNVTKKNKQLEIVWCDCVCVVKKITNSNNTIDQFYFKIRHK